MTYIANTDADRQAMLDELGLSSMDELFADVPSELRAGQLELPPGQWVVNVYYFTWANRVDTRVKIKLEPGPDCPQHGGSHAH